MAVINHRLGEGEETLVVIESAGASNGIYELSRDFQGSILSLIDRSTNQVVERYRYSPLGEVSIENGSGSSLASSAFGNSRLFLGRIWDAEVGLYDLRNRWLEPDTGLFISTDPLLAVDSWNMYQYGFSSPATWMDPFGLNQEPGDQNPPGHRLPPVPQPAFPQEPGPTYPHDFVGPLPMGATRAPAPEQPEEPAAKPRSLGSKILGVAGTVAAFGVKKVLPRANPFTAAAAWGYDAVRAGIWCYDYFSQDDDSEVEDEPDHSGVGGGDGGGDFEKKPEGDNTKVNKYTDWLKKRLNLTKEQARELHEEIMNQKLTNEEIRRIAEDIAGKKLR